MYARNRSASSIPGSNAVSESLNRCREAIRKDNDRINAVLDVFDVHGQPPEGPLRGMVMGIKANIAVRGQCWHAGIKAYENQVATKDARVVARLREAGAIILANLNMEEGALGAQTDNPWFGKTHNPLKTGFTPGGSSGGSAAAVAAGFVEAALGTDTMGSVRVPSAYCGLWGFKPSHDPDMLDGVMPLSPVLDTVGAHGETLSDVVRIVEVITKGDFTGGRTGNVSRLDWGDQVACEADVIAAFELFCEEKGITQSSGLAPYDYSASRRAGLLISEVEGYAIHEHHMETQPEGFSEFFAGMLQWGHDQSMVKIDKAYDHLTALRNADFADFILMPTTPQTAFKFGSTVPVNQADFTAFANLADRPAICFPIGIGKHGLPVSAQLVGPRGREADLVATVKALFS